MIFNFEEWAQLARQDKAAFEKKRAATIRRAIEDTAHNDRERRMLNGLQFKVDMVRRQHRTPLGACIALSDMLMEQVNHLISLDFNELIDSVSSTTSLPHEKAKIIPFHSPKK